MKRDPTPVSPASILDQLVGLHERRLDEEQAGTVRGPRPEYQRPWFALDATAHAAGASTASTAAVEPPPEPWPADAIGQITALRALVFAGPVTVDEATRRFTSARREIVARHLETLAILGEVLAVGGDQYAAVVPVF